MEFDLCNIKTGVVFKKRFRLVCDGEKFLNKVRRSKKLMLLGYRYSSDPTEVHWR